MEGLGENTAQQQIHYFSVIGNKITQRLKEHVFDKNGKQLSTERIHEADDGSKKTIIEREYSDITGSIESAFIKEGKFGYTAEIRLSKAGNLFNLSFALNSSYARSFFLKLPNINTDKEVMFVPYNFVDKTSGKKRVGFTVIQKECNWTDDKVPNFWTQTSPGELPPMDIDTDAMGKTTYDSKKRDKFLNKYFLDWCKELESITGSTAKPQQEASSMAQETAFTKEQAPQLDEEEDDDLPF